MSSSVTNWINISLSLSSTSPATGSVFRVIDSAGNPHAVKIFYPHIEPVLETMFEPEALAYQHIRGRVAAQTKHSVNTIRSIVRQVGFTNTFLSSPACQFLDKSGVLLQLGIEVSDFAVVMELYDGTLKDLFENRQSGMESEAVEESADNRTGYEVLRGLTFEMRIRTIKPFLDGIAEGLMSLHRASCIHQDLSLSNILYRLGT